MGDVAVAALAAVNTITVTSELAAPALQRRKPHAQQQGQRTGPGTIRHSLVQDLQGLLAVGGRRQWSASSPQKAWIFFLAISSAAASAKAFSFRLSSWLSRLISR